MTLAELRLDLVDCRANLKISRGELDILEARVAACVNGKNAEERKVNLVLALAESDAYGAALYDVRYDETEIDRLEALIENAKDERRAYEWSIRERHVLAIEALGCRGSDEEEAYPF